MGDFSSGSNVFYNAGRAEDGITVTFGDSVRKIPAYAFYVNSSSYRPNIKSVTIGNGVTSIGDSAFEGCSGLTSVIIGDSVTNIDSSVFEDCIGLTTITIPDSVTSIGYEAFRGCSGLTSITIGNGVTSIGSYAFYNCSGLTEINWNAISVSDFSSGNNVFYNAGTAGDGITVTFGDGVEKIPAYAFYVNSSSYRPNIVSVTIGNSVTSIGSSAFYGCSGLTEINWNAVSVSDFSSGNNVFYNVGTAGNGINVTFGNSVQKIPAYAFYYCSGLTSVTIGNSVTSIGSSAFRGCSGLTSIYYAGDVADWCGISGLNNIMSSGRVLYIGGNKVEGAVTIPDGVTSIPSYAFAYLTGITSVTIPDSVTSIGSSAFNGCYALVEVYNKSSLDIKKGNSGYGYVAYYAKNVYTAQGGSQITTDENGLVFIFADGKGYLVDYVGTAYTLMLPESFTAYDGTTVNSYDIYKHAFSGCSGLTSVTIPDSVTSIGYEAFCGCTGLTSVIIGNIDLGYHRERSEEHRELCLLWLQQSDLCHNSRESYEHRRLCFLRLHWFDGDKLECPFRKRFLLLQQCFLQCGYGGRRNNSDVRR